MRFLVMAMMSKDSLAGPPPKPEAFVAMQEYNGRAAQAGVLLAAEGLMPPAAGARIKFNAEQATIIDGPYTEAKEIVAGFSIIKVKSLEEAIAWVTGAPKVGDGVIEIRRLMDIEDFGEGFTPNEDVAKVKFR